MRVPPTHHRAFHRLILGGMCLLSMVGCQYLPHRATVARDGQPQYERADIVYELDGSQRPLPLRLESLTPGDDAEKLAENPDQLWTQATLTVQYPHRDLPADMARATLRLTSGKTKPTGWARAKLDQAERFLGWDRSQEASVTSAPDANSQKDDEIWVLDLPLQQIDLLLADLEQEGYFTSQTRQQAGTRLGVTLNRGKTVKEWSPEPRLDHFMARVYHEGRLSGLVASSSGDSSGNFLAGR